MRKFFSSLFVVFLLLDTWGPALVRAAPAWKRGGAGPPGLSKMPPGQAKKRIHYKGEGPPPWAPAHGYRRKRRRGAEAYHSPFKIAAGRCDRDEIGKVLGGVAGGVVGSKIGKGDGKTVATIAGSVIGVIVGGAIGREMDRLDRACVGQVLEYAGSSKQVGWTNPDTGKRYQVRTGEIFQKADDRYCREYTTTSTIGGREVQRFGTACRQPDGAWRLVN